MRLLLLLQVHQRVPVEELDLRGQLTSVNYPDGTGERFAFDGSGNIVEYDKVNGAAILAELWGKGADEISAAVEAPLDDKEVAKINEELGDLGDLDLDL